MKFSLMPSANRVGLNEDVSKIADWLGGARRGKAGRGQSVRCKARLSEARLLQASSEFIAGCTGGNSNLEGHGRAGLCGARQGVARQG